jgi:glutaredoxin
MSHPTVVLYGKPGCTVCDDARGLLETFRERRSFELREVDVSLDPVLHRRYGERIPVVEVDGEVVMELHMYARVLEEALDRVGA